MSEYYLRAGLSTYIYFTPTYASKDKTAISRSQHRTIDQHLYSYKWNAYPAYEFEVEGITVAAATQINAWWRVGYTLILGNSSSAFSFFGYITGEAQPFVKYNDSKTLYMKGKFAFESTFPYDIYWYE